MKMEDMYRPVSLSKPVRKSGTISGVFKPPVENENKDITIGKDQNEEESLEHEAKEGMSEQEQENLLNQLISQNPAMVQRVLRNYMRK